LRHGLPQPAASSAEQKAVSRRPGEPEQHRLARCGGKAVFRGLSQHMPGPLIGDDQPAVLRKKLGRDIAMRGEEQPVAVLPDIRATCGLS
jgi:hypothetical protein